MKTINNSKYNKEYNIPFVQDSSNQKDVYTRNRFRKYIVPEFKKEDFNVHKKFYKFSNTLLEYNAYIDRQVRDVIPQVFVQTKHHPSQLVFQYE